MPPPLPDPEQLARPWLSSYPPGVPPTYDYPDVPLTRFLDDAARDFPEVTATWFEGATIVYADLLDLVDRLAAALGEIGIGRGTRVGVLLSNLPAAPVVTFAAHRLGAVVVWLDPVRTDLLRQRLGEARCRLIVCDATLAHEVTAVRAHLPDLTHVVVTDAEDWLPTRRRIVARFLRRVRRQGPGPVDEVVTLADLVSGHDPIARQEPVEGDHPALIHYTAGTTRRARPVVLTHANLVANAFQARLWLPDTQAGRERILLAAPLHHLHGFTVGLLEGVLSASTLVLVREADPAAAIAAIAATSPTLAPLSARLLTAIAGHPDARRRDLASIRACLVGGGPVAVEVARRFEELSGARVRESYGLTEAAPLTHANPIYGRAKAGRVGLPVTDTLAVVVDPDAPTAVLPQGEKGELLVRGPQISPGYLDAGGNPLVDGWLRTGDLAEVDEDGSFAVVDRIVGRSAGAPSDHPEERSGRPDGAR